MTVWSCGVRLRLSVWKWYWQINGKYRCVVKPCCSVCVCVGEEEWSADLAGIWESRPRPDRRGMCGSQPACLTSMSALRYLSALKAEPFDVLFPRIQLNSRGTGRSGRPNKIGPVMLSHRAATSRRFYFLPSSFSLCVTLIPV